MDADRVIADLKELAELTGGPDGARRVCWTDEWVKARELVRGKLEELPVEITTDAAGNVWADLPGEQEGFVIVGSHVDSVPAGGWLDGALGLFAALEVLRAHADGERPVGLRFVDWADEEGARFGRSLFGSSACAGTLEIDEVRDLKDREGKRLEDVVGEYDVDLSKVHESGSQLQGARAYLELHIEQGPVLESRYASAAAGLGRVGVERRAAVFSGRASHAGATPMDMRQDSFLAAARAALAIREIGLAHEGGYCTTGGASSEPGVVTAVSPVDVTLQALDTVVVTFAVAPPPPPRPAPGRTSAGGSGDVAEDTGAPEQTTEPDPSVPSSPPAPAPDPQQGSPEPAPTTGPPPPTTTTPPSSGPPTSSTPSPPPSPLSPPSSTEEDPGDGERQGEQRGDEEEVAPADEH